MGPPEACTPPHQQPRAACSAQQQGPSGRPAPAASSGAPQHSLAQRLVAAYGPSLALSLLLLFSSAPSLAQQRQEMAGIGSVLDESLLQAVKKLGGEVDGALSRVVLPPGLGASPEAVAAATQDAHQLINEVWQVVDDNYLDARGRGFDRTRWLQLREEALARSYGDKEAGFRAVREMLARGTSDPYTRFLGPGEFAKMAKYDVTGVGLNLGSGEDFTRKTGLALPGDRAEELGGVWVVGMIKGSPADAGGISQGDQLLEVDGQPVEGQSPFQVAALISGAAGERAGGSGDQALDAGNEVTIRVRKPDGGVRMVAVQRPQRWLKSPISYSLKPRGAAKVGYIKLKSFNARAHTDLEGALADLAAQGADEFVLDLRDNRGGLVSEGIEAARLFLYDDAIIVSQLGGQRMGPQTVKADGRPQVTAPLTVLVNETTASASEILAGALKDNCRAVLVGKRTYGKGLIQSVYELSDASGLVLTVGKYLTPSGTDIDLGGIRPDFKSTPSTAAAAQTLQACRVVRA